MGFEPTCPCGQLHFECSSLQPLRYASVYKYSLLGTNHMISSAARYDHFDTLPYPLCADGGMCCESFLAAQIFTYHTISFCKIQVCTKNFWQSADKSVVRTKRSAGSLLCPAPTDISVHTSYCLAVSRIPCLFQILRIQALKLVDDEQTILANQYIIKPNFAAAVFRTLNHNQIPVNRRLVAVERVLVGHARR